MDISDAFGLPFPEGDDPQAVALYMKDLAFLLDDLLTQANDPTVAFNDRPCAYWGAIGESLSANSSTAVDWNLASPLAYNGDQSQSGAPNTTPRLPDPRHGLWLIGACVPSLTPTGTANAGTERWLNARCTGIDNLFRSVNFMGSRFPVSAPVDSSGRGIIEDLSYETNVGAPGTPLTIQGLAWIPADTPRDPATGAIGRIEIDLGNRNTSSGFTIAANGAFCWAVWLGYGTDQIVSV